MKKIVLTFAILALTAMAVAESMVRPSSVTYDGRQVFIELRGEKFYAFVVVDDKRVYLDDAIADSVVREMLNAK